MKKMLIRLSICLLVALVFYGKIEIKAEDNTIILEVGEKKQLTGKGYFGSTDKNVATVSKKGKITAQKAGKCQVVYIDKKNNATIYNITVNGKSKKKNSLYIGQNGWEYEAPVYYFSGINVTLDKTTLGELVALLEDTKYYIPDIDISSNGIYSSDEIFWIRYKDGDLAYNVYCAPAPSKYLKDMVVTGILPEGTNKDEYLNDYWLKKIFSIKNAPSFDNFKEEIIEKFSGYIDGNIEITEYGDSYMVTIKVDKESVKDLGYYVRTVAFWYSYDKSNRKCNGVSYIYR